MVLKIFASIAGLAKVRVAYVDVDSHVFRLHYRLTASICFIACALVSASEYIGKPIQCMTKDGPVDGPINTYCWIASTFTINTTDEEGDIHGLGNHNPRYHEKTVHSYYQWVPFILFFQGCLFYFPHLLWKSNERKTAVKLLQGLHRFSVDKDIEKKKENIIKYLRDSKGQNMNYSLIYHIFELLNFVNVLGQMFALDAFFNGTFMQYGTKVVNYAIDETTRDPFKTIFPKVTKCHFQKYGPSGTIIDIHPLCVLPQNILNEKVFIIMWFWFIILATVTAIQLIWRAVVCLSPVIRVRILEQRGKLDVSAGLERCIQRLHLGDFFLLEIVGRNLDVSTFNHILKGAVLDGDEDAGTRSLYPPLPATDDGIDAVELNEIEH